MDDWMFFALGIAVVAYMLFKLIKYGTFKNALFGARITKTFGAVTGKKLGVTNVIKIHALDEDGNGEIGLEIVSKSFGSWQMQPVNISKEDARKLSQYLEAAAREGK